MKRRIFSILTALVMSLLIAVPALTDTAEAADLDYIRNYDVTVTPDSETGSLLMEVHLRWEVLDEGPVTWVQVGIPNGSIYEANVLSDNISELSYDNSFMRVDFDRGYDNGEIIDFSYSWVQEYMYDLNVDGAAVMFDYTPGWFDEAEIGEMTLTWKTPDNLEMPEIDYYGSVEAEREDGGSFVRYTARNLGHGQTMSVSAFYENWPTELPEENSSSYLPEDDYEGYDDGSFGRNLLLELIPVIVALVALIIFLSFIVHAASSYHGGFGTRYVFVHGLWYPAGRDGKPRPGSTGTHTKPKPPRKSGFGGGSHGGGFGGSGFGGGSHCACASSCACACACACAGGGRAGCSAKNLYGAIHLSHKLTEQLDSESGK